MNPKETHEANCVFLEFTLQQWRESRRALEARFPLGHPMFAYGDAMARQLAKDAAEYRAAFENAPALCETYEQGMTLGINVLAQVMEMAQTIEPLLG